jgi:hypothetical protein
MSHLSSIFFGEMIGMIIGMLKGAIIYQDRLSYHNERKAQHQTWTLWKCMMKTSGTVISNKTRYLAAFRLHFL